MAARGRPGLRERKKERTRTQIRREAYRLFREQGYTETTTEQIALAADVSPSTFFRYFPTKEALILSDDLDPLLMRSLKEQPVELSLSEAFRRTASEVAESVDEAELEFDEERQRLLYSVPELRGALMQEMERNIDLLSEIVAYRSGRAPTDFHVRALAGAYVGAYFGATDRTGGRLPDAMQIAEFFDSGMRL